MNLFAGVTPALNARSRSLFTLPGMTCHVSGQIEGTFTATLVHQIRKVGSSAWTTVNVEDMTSATDAEVASHSGTGGVYQTGELAGEWEYSVLISAYTSGIPIVNADVEV